MKTKMHTQADAQPAAKQPYEPPKATFVRLKLEERLLVCWKQHDYGESSCQLAKNGPGGICGLGSALAS